MPNAVPKVLPAPKPAPTKLLLLSPTSCGALPQTISCWAFPHAAIRHALPFPGAKLQHPPQTHPKPPLSPPARTHAPGQQSLAVLPARLAATPQGHVCPSGKLGDSTTAFFCHLFVWHARKYKEWQQSSHWKLAGTETNKTTPCLKAGKNLAWIAVFYQDRDRSLTCIWAETPTFFLLAQPMGQPKKGRRVPSAALISRLPMPCSQEPASPSHVLRPLWWGDSKHTDVAGAGRGALLGTS